MIELLVVVLIIGILAAVALPQYRVAVQKTRTMRLLPMLRAINDAENVYFLENGHYTLSFSDLSIDVGPISVGSDGWKYAERAGYSCHIQGTESLASAYCDDTTPGAPNLEKYFHQSFFQCWTAPNTLAEKICKSISGRNTPNSTTENVYYFR